MPASRQRVIGAIYELAGRHNGRWPTMLEIADYLEEPPHLIGEHLQHLKRTKLFRDRWRQKRNVWMPWEQA